MAPSHRASETGHLCAVAEHQCRRSIGRRRLRAGAEAVLGEDSAHLGLVPRPLKRGNAVLEGARVNGLGLGRIRNSKIEAPLPGAARGMHPAKPGWAQATDKLLVLPRLVVLERPRVAPGGDLALERALLGEGVGRKVALPGTLRLAIVGRAKSPLAGESLGFGDATLGAEVIEHVRATTAARVERGFVEASARGANDRDIRGGAPAGVDVLYEW